MLKQFLAPLLLAVGFHGLVIGLFLIEWPDDDVLRVAEAPLYISAALVTPDVPEKKVSQQKPAKSKPVVVPPTLKPKPKPKPKPRQIRKRRLLSPLRQSWLRRRRCRRQLTRLSESP